MSSEITRRGILIAGGVGLLTAACGTAQVPHTKQFVRGHFTSAAMNGSRVGWTIGYPKGHERERLPVVISLHGRGADNATTFTSLGLGEVLDDVVAGGTAPFAIASVDGGDHSYWHPRADGTDASSMVRTEFVRVLAREGLDSSRIGLYGWSMGGYGALLIAGKQNFPVKGVAVASPALFTSSGSTAVGAYDDAADFDRNDVYGHPGWFDGLRLRVDCGRQDPFYPATHDFVSRLAARPAGGFIDGKHEATYWRKVAPGQLRFLGTRLAD